MQIPQAFAPGGWYAGGSILTYDRKITFCGWNHLSKGCFIGDDLFFTTFSMVPYPSSETNVTIQFNNGSKIFLTLTLGVGAQAPAHNQVRFSRKFCSSVYFDHLSYKFAKKL